MFRTRRRLTMWALLTVALPAAARLAQRLASSIESRQGPTPTSRRLLQGAHLAGLGSRGSAQRWQR